MGYKMDRILRSLKKEYLLVKKDRELNFEARENKLFSILDKESFHMISCEVSHVIFMKFNDRYSGSSLALEPNVFTDSKELIDKKIIALNSHFSENRFLIVLPLDWELYGGLIINSETLFSNFERISYFLEDGMFILNNSLDQVIKIRLERQMSDSELNYLEIYDWSNRK